MNTNKAVPAKAGTGAVKKAPAKKTAPKLTAEELAALEAAK
jgi:hypothetical protein